MPPPVSSIWTLTRPPLEACAPGSARGPLFPNLVGDGMGSIDNQVDEDLVELTDVAGHQGRGFSSVSTSATYLYSFRAIMSVFFQGVIQIGKFGLHTVRMGEFFQGEHDGRHALDAAIRPV